MKSTTKPSTRLSRPVRTEIVRMVASVDEKRSFSRKCAIAGMCQSKALRKLTSEWNPLNDAPRIVKKEWTGFVNHMAKFAPGRIGYGAKPMYHVRS